MRQLLFRIGMTALRWSGVKLPLVFDGTRYDLTPMERLRYSWALRRWSREE